MPVYTYRREDGTTFDYRQKFSDDPLDVCPTTGQKVVRVVHAPRIIFKGSGFYVTDSKKASNGNLAASKSSAGESKSDTDGETKTETKSDAKTETKSETTETKQGAKAESAAD